MSHRQKNRHMARHRTHAVKPDSLFNSVLLPVKTEASPSVIPLSQPEDIRGAHKTEADTQTEA